MPTKDEIKEAVSESLLEALKVAEERQRQDSMSFKSIMSSVISVIQVFLVPILAYLLLQSVQVQKEIVAIRAQITAVNTNVESHIQKTDEKDKVAGIIHHTGLMSTCTGCHNQPARKAK